MSPFGSDRRYRATRKVNNLSSAILLFLKGSTPPLLREYKWEEDPVALRVGNDPKRMF